MRPVGRPPEVLIVTSLGIAGALALILANAFFVAVEFSLVAADRMQVEARAAEGSRRARLVLGALERLSLHLSGVQMGITVTSVVLGFVAQPTIASALRAPLALVLSDAAARSWSLVVALALATVVQMVVGELIPKAVAVARPIDTAERLAVPTAVFMRLFGLVIRVVGSVADGAVRRLGVEPQEELSSVRSRSELRRLVATSRDDGTLNEAEADLLARAFRFGDKTAADVLTPRPDLVTLGVADTGGDLIDLSVRTGLSRFPVAGTDVDDIVGVVHVKSVLDVPAERRRSAPVSDLMTPPFVVPESRDLGHLMIEMRSQSVHLAVVLDEYGGTSGIVSLEDLLEEIVGEIDDEHDGARRMVRPLGRTMLVSGGLHLDDVLEQTGLELPDGPYETLAGFVLDRLGRIPTVGTSIEVLGWTFTVVRMDRRRIDTIQLVAPRPDVEDGAS